MQGSSVYVTGESYAGFYIPYIADAFITAANNSFYKLAGIAINDPTLGDDVIQQGVTIMPFVDQWKNVLKLNESDHAALQRTHHQCHYDSYYSKYFTFPPPPGPFPQLPEPYDDPPGNGTCDILTWVLEGAMEINPRFNIYHITDMCPFPYDHLGQTTPGDYIPAGAVLYFNRSDVQAAINAPVGTKWIQCTAVINKDIFLNGVDHSYPPAMNGVLQRVVEHTNNTIIGAGNLDLLINPIGTLFILQNLTWNGLQGFQSDPRKHDLYIPYHPEYNGSRLSEAGIVGTYGQERGLRFYTVQLAGHELPGYSAGLGYRILELLLGRIKHLGDIENFSTQSGAFGNDPHVVKTNE